MRAHELESHGLHPNFFAWNAIAKKSVNLRPAVPLRWVPTTTTRVRDVGLFPSLSPVPMKRVHGCGTVGGSRQGNLHHRRT